MERAGRVLSRLKLPNGAVAGETLALAGWPAAVGKRIAAHSRPLSLSNGRLHVEVEDLVWKKQLTALKGQILRRLIEVIGKGVVRDLHFCVAPRRRQPQRAAALHVSPDEANRIEDPVLRSIYRAQRAKRSA